MTAALISLLIMVLIVGIVVYIVLLLIDRIPMDGTFKQIAKILVILIAVLIILVRALPLLNVSLGI